MTLDFETIEKTYRENQIKEDDFEFLKKMLFEEKSKFEVPREQKKFAKEFSSGVISQNEYSYLVFEYITIHYVDEYGKKFKTEIKEEK